MSPKLHKACSLCQYPSNRHSDGGQQDSYLASKLWARQTLLQYVDVSCSLVAHGINAHYKPAIVTALTKMRERNIGDGQLGDTCLLMLGI